MILKSLVLVAFGGTHTWAAFTGGSGPGKRQSTTAKYCPGGTQICFSEFREPASGISYRIAIPEVSAAPFDVLLQIVAPVDKAGWAGVAWGGTMNGNPLTVGWPNGDGAVVSSRWSTQWEGGSLDPNGVNSLAWAKNTRVVNSASSNTSSFAYHDGRGVFDHDLSVAKVPQGVFDAIVYALNNPTPPETDTASAVSTAATTVAKPTTTSSRSTTPTRLTELPGPSSAPVKTASAVVTTRVTQLPKPTSTSIRGKPPVSPTSNSATKKPTTPSVVTITVTAQPPTTTQGDDDGDDDGWGEWPPWTGGGGPPWGGGKGKGKGGGGGWGRGGWRRGKRDRLIAPPGEY
ncbi:hypothetical protein F5144DRAFT_655390 [Chaetomium tenue]|uniref:Uncharacterized protein n=1 Tax=Chaetomium tenue TaxID=1854479 RepID=A0ACB7P4B7_9PEZI|nr:hypothetical protein F5144DRAFT_655390 [Chaetomium globosum]